MEAIGQLTSGVAHDFNNLLTVVIGNVNLIALDRHATRHVRQLAEARTTLGLKSWVTDITLPGRMTGLDLVRKARELTPDLKILTISGNASEESIRTSDIDSCAFLSKPFRPSELNMPVGDLF
jgi:DNA-binding NtrC family response regulator